MTPNDPRSPVWGGLTLAAIIGVLFGVASIVLGWGQFFQQFLRAVAVVFTIATVIGLPADIVSIVRRTPMAARAIGESIWGVGISAALIYFAFVAR